MFTRMTYCLILMTFIPSLSNAQDPKLMDFILKNVHSKGFTKCDSAIREAFSYVGGIDMRVVTMSGLHEDSMKVVTVFGNVGDAIYQEAEFRSAGTTTTSTIVSKKSCIATLSELPAFKFESDVVGVTFAKNAGGVNMVLMPNGAQGCTSVYIRDGKA